jgi:hypothetical protein
MIAMALDLPPRRPTQAHSSSTRFSDALVRPVYLVKVSSSSSFRDSPLAASNRESENPMQHDRFVDVAHLRCLDELTKVIEGFHRLSRFRSQQLRQLRHVHGNWRQPSLPRGSFLSLVELLQKHAEREGKHKAPMKTMRNMRPLMAHSARLTDP